MFKKVVEYFTNLWYSIFRIEKFRGIGIMKRGFSAIDFANWFLWYNEVEKINQLQATQDDYDVYEGLTHLKIQKLLYFADGVNLAINDEPLFKEKIYAWQHGPVVKEVYEKLKTNGNKDIEFDKDYYETIKKINENSSIFEVLVSVYDSYAGYTAWQLREKSHIAGGPWQITVDTKGPLKEIDRKLIKEYFRKNIVKIEND